jgi:osmoprotectant transport system ATP-binding protein
VFGPGGVLQQYDEPPSLLANPANDFVAGFIGADRGYRGLQFFHASGLPLQDVGRVGEWELVAKPDGSPLGWRNSAHRLVAGGSLLRPDGTLRHALDAALSSPSGVGVAVDADGRVIGGVRVEDVLEALAAQRNR